MITWTEDLATFSNWFFAYFCAPILLRLDAVKHVWSVITLFDKHLTTFWMANGVAAYALGNIGEVRMRVLLRTRYFWTCSCFLLSSTPWIVNQSLVLCFSRISKEHEKSIWYATVRQWLHELVLYVNCSLPHFCWLVQQVAEIFFQMSVWWILSINKMRADHVHFFRRICTCEVGQWAWVTMVHGVARIIWLLYNYFLLHCQPIRVLFHIENAQSD